MARVALAVCLLAVVPACSRGSGIPEGHALLNGALWRTTQPVSPPGTEFTFSFPPALVQTVGGATITLDHVSVPGQGIGTVLRVLRVWVGPIYGTDSLRSAPSGNMSFFPPVTPVTVQGKLRCAVQQLLPVHGYVLRPGRVVRLVAIIEAARPGTYSSPGPEVYYWEHGTEYRELLTFAVNGVVRRGAPPLRGGGPDRATRRVCRGRYRMLP